MALASCLYELFPTNPLYFIAKISLYYCTSQILLLTLPPLTERQANKIEMNTISITTTTTTTTGVTSEEG